MASDVSSLAIAVPAVVAVAVAVASATYVTSVRLAQRKDRLDRVTRQVSDFYGPLLALSNAGASAWQVFRSATRPGRAFWGQDPPPSDAEQLAWRRWIEIVFMPLNRQMRDLVVSRADLLIETEMEKCLLALCAHVAAYEAIVSRWHDGDFTANKPPLPFPRDVAKYAKHRYQELKEEQRKLLATPRPLRSWRPPGDGDGLDPGGA